MNEAIQDPQSLCAGLPLRVIANSLPSFDFKQPLPAGNDFDVAVGVGQGAFLIVNYNDVQTLFY